MAFKRFRAHVIVRTLVLAFSVSFLFFLLFRTQLFAAMFITAVLIIYQVYSLIRYVEVTNRDLTRFFESIKYGDFTQSFKDDKLGRSFAALRQTYNEVADAFRATRAEKEEHYRYLQTVVQHVGIGLIAFQPDGEVELINTAAKRLLDLSHLKNIKSLNSLSPKLVEALFRLNPRERDLIKVESESGPLQLALYATEFKLRSQVFTLVSLQNIQSELEETEIEAWQRLIRVLTHEIMNSITPISSLASTIHQLIQESLEGLNLPEGSDSEMLDDIQQALQTIQKRSQGLMHFVDAYRNYTLTPKANYSIFSIRELFTRVEKLMQANIKDRGILFHSRVEPENLELTADPELIEQVLINLLLNALQSVEKKEGGRIDLLAALDPQGRILVQVKDNGPGIREENLDKIFIPFFSTKEGGSGIGLSLSRQIMRQHKGTLSVHSEPELKTIFTLRF
jgi:nitrogen fixation/metabolism regulation signal transduction histidine kinase